MYAVNRYVYMYIFFLTGNVFHIDNDGTLTVTGIIDRETTEMYSIEIMVCQSSHRSFVPYL